MSEDRTDIYLLAGILVRFLQRNPEAGYCLVEALVPPGAGPPPNRHPSDDEVFYVLEGTFEFDIGSATRTAATGEFVHIPLGEAHTFKNAGEAPGRLLILNTPGSLHVGFYSQGGAPVPSGPWKLPDPMPAPDVARVLDAGRRNGMEFLLPGS